LESWACGRDGGKIGKLGLRARRRENLPDQGYGPNGRTLIALGARGRQGYFVYLGFAIIGLGWAE